MGQMQAFLSILLIFSRSLQFGSAQEKQELVIGMMTFVLY